MSGSDFLVEFQGIAKRFGGVQALDGVSFGIPRGKIHGLVGENGAGKSTLIKILGGVYICDEGSVLLDGRPFVARAPADALKMGIDIVHQELPLCPNLTVSQNVFLRSPLTKGLGRMDWRAMNEKTQALFDRIGQSVDPEAPVSSLSVAEQQLTSIVKALKDDCRLLILDEPTAALTPSEVQNLFSVLRQLRDQGTTILFVSHILSEIFELTDTITVLRNGRHVGTRPTAELTPAEVVQMMVGREVGEEAASRARRRRGEEPILRVEGLSHRRTGLENISFELYPQEILGIAGIQGAGRTELAQCLFGVDPPDEGEIFLDGLPVRIASPRDAIERGIGYLVEDRRNLGLFWELSVKKNMLSAVISRVQRLFGLLDNKKMSELGERSVERLLIRTESLEQKVRFLSGGNQQKALLARWLNVEPRILILDEPTRGVDVGAKSEIRRVIRELVEGGLSVIVISSDLEELLAISDRVLVMGGRRIQGVLDAEEATMESVMALATVR